MLPLGPNGYGEYLQPGRVTDCYLGILLDQPLPEILPEPGSVLVIAPAALLHPQIPQPHGRVLYNLVTGHRDRAPHDLVFLADLIHSPHSASCSKAIPGYQLRWGPEQLERRDKPAWRKG